MQVILPIENTCVRIFPKGAIGLDSLLTRCIEIYNFHRKGNYRLFRYLLKDGKSHPVAVICPGGGYHRIDSYAEGYPYARKLNSMGYHAFVLYYRYDENGSWPIPMEDLVRAIREISSHAGLWNLDMENYSLWGSSAGGHLAALFATESGYARYGLPRPGAVILSYPVITMGPFTHPGSRDHLLGPSPSASLVRHTSAENQITADYPPTFLWWSSDDAVVDPENSLIMHRALEEKGVPHESRCYSDVAHGVGIGLGLPCEGWFERAVAFWEKYRT